MPPAALFLCIDKEIGERKRLRRGRFRILPLLRTTPIETAKKGAPAPFWMIPQGTGDEGRKAPAPAPEPPVG